jgi:hypothetical protein
MKGIASSIFSIGIIFIPSLTKGEISSKSISLSCGISTVEMPERLAARSFSFSPPMGEQFLQSNFTCHRYIIGSNLVADSRIIAIVIVVPAEGYPSELPSGRWI